MKDDNRILELGGKTRPRFAFAGEMLDNVPQLEEMGREELTAYKNELEDGIGRLDAVEPKNENSEAYEEWAQLHEDLEDVLDEVLDLLEEMK